MNLAGIVAGSALALLALISGVLPCEVRKAAHADYELRLWDMLAEMNRSGQPVTAHALSIAIDATERKVRRTLIGWANRGLVRHCQAGFYNDHPQHDTFQLIAH